MAFCRYCGKKLNEGEVCNCNESQNVDIKSDIETNPQDVYVHSIGSEPSTQPIDFAGKAKEFWNNFVKVIKAPATEGSQYVITGDRVDSICFIVLQAILSGLFGMFMIIKLNSQIESALGSITDAYKFSVGKAFLITFLFSIVFSAVFGGLFALASIIVKTQIKVDQVLGVLAVKAMVSMPIIVISYIVLFLNVSFGMLVFYSSCIFVICTLMEAIRRIQNMNENKMVYMMFVICILFYIIAVLIMDKAAGLYLPASIKKEIGNIRSLSSLFNNIFS